MRKVSVARPPLLTAQAATTLCVTSWILSDVKKLSGVWWNAL